MPTQAPLPRCIPGEPRPRRSHPARRPLRPGRQLASLLFASLLGASLLGVGSCSGSSSEPAPLTELTPPQAGAIVAAFDVQVPSAEEFLLHGTLPLPRGAWTDVHSVEPFVVLDSDGSPVVTQAEVVSRYASDADGVDVAQVLARVRRSEDTPPGSRAVYAVTWAPHEALRDPDGIVTPIETLQEPPFPIAPSLKAWLSNAASLQVELIDVFGNRYLAAPLDGTGVQTLLHHGPVEVEVRVAETLQPAPAKSGPEGTLPHSLGLHAYLSLSDSSDFLHFDLRLHNAHSGLDPADPDDDPLGRVYFREINLLVPNGWVVVQDFVDPFYDLPKGAGGTQVHPLVAANADGTMHVMDWQAQFHRRLAIAPAASWKKAQEETRGAGLGFARAETKPDGFELWSWWNSDTARWFPQSVRLPSLDHVDDQEIVTKLTLDAEEVQSHLEQGTSAGGYPVPDTVLGWAHPYGVPYGGMAGGTEIHLFDGVRTLEAAAPEGYRLARIVHRMHTDRQPNALYDGDGEPTHVEDWVVPVPGGKDYVPFFHFIKPSLSDVDPFGVHAAPTFQVAAVEAAGLQPAYQDAITNYAPHDYQHLIRYTRSAKVLAWLDDDPLAQDDLRMQAANFLLSYHRWYNSPYQHIQSTGFRFDRDYVDEFPQSGFTFGRGEGWALDCVVAAYATGSPAWRAKHRAWLNNVCDLVADGQSLCNGFIQANVNEKFLDAKYRARQMIEQSIVENALLGMLETVYRGEDVARTALLEDVLTRSMYAMLSEMAWAPEQDAPWAFTAVGPLDDYEPVWCSVADLPEDGQSDWTDAYQNWSSFAYGYHLTQDPVFLQFAQKQMGGGDLLGSLLADGLKNLENRAALLALVQEMAGL